MTRNAIMHLDGWSSKIFASFGGFVRLDFYPLRLLSYGAFVHFGFSLYANVTAWRECWLSTPVSCDHMTRNEIVHLDGWSIKIFASFGGFVRINFYPLGLLSYGAFVHFGFSLSAHVTEWWECWLSTPVSCDHMTRNGIMHLDGWSSKIFASFGGFVRLDFYPLGLLSYGAFVHFAFSLYANVTAWWECWLSTPVSCDHMTRNEIVHLDGWSIKIFSSFKGFVRIDFYPLGLLSYGAFVHFGFSLSAHVTAWRECWLSTSVSCDHMTRNGIMHLDGWSSKIFASFGGCVSIDFYPLGLLSYGAFVPFGFTLSAHLSAWWESWLSAPVSCDHMTRNGIVDHDGFSSEIFASFGVFVRLIFILWGCCPMVLLSILSLLCPSTLPSDENVDCPHLYHVITWPEMGSCTLMVGVEKYFHLFNVLSALIFILWGCCPMVILSILTFLCPPTWPHDENVDCPHLYHVITWPEMLSCTLMVGVEKYFHLLGFLSTLIFILWGCCPMVLLSILSFLCPPTWKSDENVDCPHLYHVITWPEMGSCTLMVVVVKYLHLLGFLSALIFILWGCCPMVLLSILTLLCPRTCPHDEKVDCPLLYHVITWPEMLSWTMMFGVAKYLHLFSGFCPPWFLSFGAVVLWCFCLFWLFSVRPRDRMTRMLIVHTCIMWSHDQKWYHAPWWLEQ